MASVASCALAAAPHAQSALSAAVFQPVNACYAGCVSYLQTKQQGLTVCNGDQYPDHAYTALTQKEVKVRGWGMVHVCSLLMLRACSEQRSTSLAMVVHMHGWLARQQAVVANSGIHTRHQPPKRTARHLGVPSAPPNPAPCAAAARPHQAAVPRAPGMCGGVGGDGSTQIAPAM